MTEKFYITCDGPVGVGKGTTMRRVAEQLNGLYIDSGKYYRGIGGLLHQQGVPFDFDPEKWTVDQNKAITAAEHFRNTITTFDPASPALAEMGRQASIVSKIPAVRAIVNEAIRLLAHDVQEQVIVADGRDAGTVIFPNADLKIFLTAAPGVRAARVFQRYKENCNRQNLPLEKTQDDIAQEVTARDHNDTTRSVDPLRKAEDAIEIRNDVLTVDQTVQRIVAEVEKCCPALVPMQTSSASHM